MGWIMARKRDLGEKLTKELRVLAVKLVFIAAALWLGIFVLPDILTALFLDSMDPPPVP